MDFFSEFQLLPNNNLQVQRVTKADEGVYRCEARVEARGEIDFRDIILVVNGKFFPSQTKCYNGCAVKAQWKPKPGKRESAKVIVSDVPRAQKQKKKVTKL